MTNSNSKVTERLDDPSRRRFFRGKVQNVTELRLPWIVNEAVFTSGCTQCQDCLHSCESNIIVKGQDGFPTIDFNQGECTFCNKCIDACQQPLFSGAFPENGSNSPENTENNINKAWPVTFAIGDKCLANNNIYCQSCRDECETSAIKFSYLDSSIPTPSLNTQDCTQCGACVKVCPQDAISYTFDTATL